MKKLHKVALAAVAAALAGTAIAASPPTHIMNVPLPDGSVARVQYVGDVAPKVTVDPAPLALGFWTSGLMSSFASFDRMMQQMDRETQAMMRHVQQAQIGRGVPGMNVASYGNMPAGADSVSIVSVSNGGATCTRRTEIVSQGAGKPPKVTSSVSGQCGASTQPRAAAPVAPRLDHS
ncbi:MAG TPA: hypothetical protein VNS11_00080 [Sphingomicrobium sp.]|nr:hypothetical protein [Sphingomicrobium sp.]